ncbi:molybdenum cofactor guanylyltransferase [Nesterenkonia sphaerica]|uniref:MobA-like NTP transferase domain-containing protein n=1 Tax=Nesterenkonia sphaerica TaxID=1804988 RepID=A0A5R9AN80_9MICC|nr:NTP transferase domain-containing protein [Nesterenkonia sphaerica]TLP80052.1 hypothetical protein FEF27_01385 [Nesterenkonia sphaerica]
MSSVHAVLLAGGAGSRLEGRDKALLIRQGRTLLDHWTAALDERGVTGVVVGPAHLRPHLPVHLRLTREQPPLSGPAAAVCAGVRALPPAATDEPDAAVLLLSVDTVDPGPLLDWLRPRLPVLRPDGHDAVVPQDAHGRLQMLSCAVRLAWLGQRVERLEPSQAAGKSLRWLIDGVSAAHPVLPSEMGNDVDTAEDARRHSIELPPAEGPI